MAFYAHSLDEAPKEDWQTLDSHLDAVAEQAAAFAESFNSRDAALLIGKLHDIGKYSTEFQRRLEGENLRVDHSTAGGKLTVERQPPGIGLLLAYAILGHHGGIPDGFGPDESCLEKRLNKELPALNLPAGFKTPVIKVLPISFSKGIQGFQAAFWVRMLFSCLVDADYLDTERFLSPSRSRLRVGYPSIEELAGRLERHHGELTAGAGPSRINSIRAEILAHCNRAAELDPGFFSLTVPTGGGKTLSSLSFALRHALRHDLQRVVYVIPYTSIIEQNASVFRCAVGDESVLEHHSNFSPSDLDQRSDLAAENWEAPLIVTTSVQFFESLFHNRPSRCRKLHNVANSVVILDEAQMLPPDLLLPCLEALRELVTNYGCTVVLCTATQPALGRSANFSRGLENVREIIPEPERYFRELERVRIVRLGAVGSEELAEHLMGHNKVLCVVNTRREAANLFTRLHSHDGAFHLSAAMCPAHRSAVLADIKNRLADPGLPCRLVSTQLIEAGVDIDFPVVFRAIAGVDSIAQAAGRCNREGKLDSLGEVFVFDPEKSPPAGHLRQSAEAAQSVLRRRENILHPEAVFDYFSLLYWQRGSRLDASGILDMLEEGKRQCLFPFREVAERFSFIPDGGEPVIIPWGLEGQSLVDELQSSEPDRQLVRKLQRFTVQVYSSELKNLHDRGALLRLHDRFDILQDLSLYSSNTGLDSRN